MSDLPGVTQQAAGTARLGTRLQGSVLFLPADLVDLCGQTWQGDALLLRSHSASRRFYFVDPDTDCGLWVRAAAPGDSSASSWSTA